MRNGLISVERPTTYADITCLCKPWASVQACDWCPCVVEQCQACGREQGIIVNGEAFVDAWKSGYRPGKVGHRC
jgi:hypothetical protein